MAQHPLGRSLAAVLALSRPLGVAPLRWTSSRPRLSAPLVRYGAVLFCATGALFVSEIVDFILLWIQNRGNSELKVVQKVFELQHKFNDLIVFALGTLRGARRMSVILGVLRELEKMKQSEPARKDSQVYYITPLLIFSLIFGLRTLEFVNMDKEGENDNIYRNLKACVVKLVLSSASDLIQLQFVTVALLIDTLLPAVNRELRQLLSENNSPTKLTVTHLRHPPPTLAAAPLRRINFTVDSIGLLTSYPVGATAAGAAGAGGRGRALGRGYAAWCRAARALAAGEGALLALHVLRLALQLATGLLSLIDTLLAIYRAAFSASPWPVASLVTSAETLFYAALLLLLVEPAHRAQAELQHTRLLVSLALGRALQRRQLELVGELRLLAAVLQLGTPGYSALGVCALGRPLVTTILSGIATVNIMILQ